MVRLPFGNSHKDNNSRFSHFASQFSFRFFFFAIPFHSGVRSSPFDRFPVFRMCRFGGYSISVACHSNNKNSSFFLLSCFFSGCGTHDTALVVVVVFCVCARQREGLLLLYYFGHNSFAGAKHGQCSRVMK